MAARDGPLCPLVGSTVGLGDRSKCPHPTPQGGSRLIDTVTPSLNLVRILALCILSLTFMAGCASSDENVLNSGPGTREVETTGQTVSEPDYTDPPTAVLVVVGRETDRSLTPQQAAALDQAIEDAGSLVNVIEACAAAQNDRPPRRDRPLAEQRRWYVEAMFQYRDCAASEATGIDFETDAKP